MGTLVQSVLPFRVEDTDKLLTANTELTLCLENLSMGWSG